MSGRYGDTTAATAARVRAADDKCAARLRDHGWLVIPPEHAGTVTVTGLDTKDET